MTTLQNEPTSASSRSNFTQRVITSVIALPIVLVAVWLGGWPFTLLVLSLALVALVEFYLLAAGRASQGHIPLGVLMVIGVVVAFHLDIDWLWPVSLGVGCAAVFIVEMLRHPNDARRSAIQTGMTLFGVLYIGFSTGFLVATRALPDGLIWLLVVLALTWGTDTFAYIGGRLWGKTKLAPAISPKKTVEGAIVGFFGGMIPALIILALSSKLTPPALILALIGPPVAIAGDLAESGMKRAFNAKDSHIRGLDLLPGHGGVLDRVDSLILVAAVTYAFIRLFALT